MAITINSAVFGRVSDRKSDCNAKLCFYSVSTITVYVRLTIGSEDASGRLSGNTGRTAEPESVNSSKEGFPVTML